MHDLFQRADIRQVSTQDQIVRAEASLGIEFPPSYKAFCATYGPGMIGNLYMIYVPLPDPDAPPAITHRVPLMRERLEDSKAFWQAEGWTIGLDVWEGASDPDLVDRAAFIGTSEDGHEIFWDVKGSGE